MSSFLFSASADTLSISIEVVGVFVSVISLMLMLLARRLSEIEQKAENSISAISSQAVLDSQVSFVKDLLSDLPESTRAAYIRYITETQRADGSLDSPLVIFADKDVPSKIKQHFQERFSGLQERLERIEMRIPEGATLDKLASVNDAILATNIESLSQAVGRLETRILTKWDIAKIVFLIVGSIIGVASLVVAVLRYILASQIM